MAKVLREARSGAPLIPAIFRRVAQEGVAPGSSPAAPAAGMGRLTHTGQWRNPVTASTKLPFGRQVLSQQQKIGKMEQLRSRRSYAQDSGPAPLPYNIFVMLLAMIVGVTIPNSNIMKRIKESRRVDG